MTSLNSNNFAPPVDPRGPIFSPGRLAVLALLVGLALLLQTNLWAKAPESDAIWPQFGGPDSNFRVPGNLELSWPAEGPKELWRVPIGDGYAGVAAFDEQLYTMSREASTDTSQIASRDKEGRELGTHEVVLAFDAKTGEELWRYAYEAAIPDYIKPNYGVGPYTTPLVTEDFVVTSGMRGTLLCLKRSDGTLIWRKELVFDLGGSRDNRGYSSSPTLFQGMALIPVGGPGQSIVAFDLKSGEIVWQAGDWQNAMASPFLVELDGQPQLIAFLNGAVAGFGPGTGELLWHHEHGERGNRNITAPLFSNTERLLFVSSAYGGGSRVLRFGTGEKRFELEQLWHSEALRVQFTTAIHKGSTVYLSSGDFGAVPLAAVETETGKILWRSREFGRSNMVGVGQHEILLTEDGELGLVTLTAEKLVVHSRHQLFDERAWTAPTLAGSVLIARSRSELVALELPME